MANELEKYQTLLCLTRLLHDAYEAGRPKPFNLFTVLRSSHDEVNLHSRFLAALLDHRDSRNSPKYLEDFVKTVLKTTDGRFDYTEAKVERERDHIDILISFGKKQAKQAIVIENKIYAEDQDCQLSRYWDTVQKREVPKPNIHLVYLTLDGKPPSSESMGSLNVPVIKLGYNSDNFQDWLRNCHQRASDEPELRESIVQYLRLVQELTGTENKGDYMDALKKLLKEGENLTLASELAEALIEEKQCLMNDLWSKIATAAANGISSGNKENWFAWKNGSNTSHSESKHPTGLYPCVQLHSGYFLWGITYLEARGKEKRNQDMIEWFKAKFDCRSDAWWLCWEDDGQNYSIGSDHTVPEFLAQKERRQECAEKIAGRLREMHDHLKKYRS